jgi:glycosyltransferase involved in cell wall biosynthesis
MSETRAILLLANDVYHHLGHRIAELLPFLEKRFVVKTISLVPPGLSAGGEQAPPGSFLRGWFRRVVRERSPSVWELPAATAVRRVPLPGFLGPLENRHTMTRAVQRRASEPFACVIAQGPVAGSVALKLDLPLLYDHADNYAAGRVGAVHRKLFQQWQDRCLSGAKAVSCAGPALRDHAMTYRHQNVALFPNGVHLHRFSVSRVESPEPVIVYVGGLEKDCGIDMALQALALLPTPPMIEIAGSGPAEGSFRKLAAALGLSERVRWLGALPRPSIPRLLSTAWIGIALFKNTEWNQYAFHLKLLEYMAAGLPFVTTPVGDAGRLTNETGAGRVVEMTPEKIAVSLADILASPTIRETMSQRGRDASRDYDWKIVGEQYASWVEVVVEDCP